MVVEPFTSWITLGLHLSKDNGELIYVQFIIKPLQGSIKIRSNQEKS